MAAEAALQLPWDFTRTPSTQHVAERFPFELRIPRIGLDREALIIAAFAIALHRYSGQATIVLDVRRSGSARALELAVANTTCRELVTLAEDGLNGAELPPKHAGATIAWDDSDPLADLTLELGAQSAIAYNANLFKRSTIERLAGHLQVLMRVIEPRLDEPIAKLPLLAAKETKWLEAVSTGAKRTLDTPLAHQMIERRAVQTPEAKALRYRDGVLTYDQLNRRANQLAHALAARSLGADSRIVVCVEPSFDIAIALLGILKAGAIYIPLDPTYPAARIASLLDDIKPDLIVSNGYLIEKLGLTGAALVLDAGALDDQPERNLELAIEPSRTAYVYFTSGTTGKPKGILATHANLHTYIEVARERYAINASDVMPAIARFSFSISMFELMSPLVAGGTLLILDRDHILAPDKLAKALTEVTFFHAGPSLLKHLLPYIKQNYASSAFDGVRHASSGGDMIPPEILESLKQIFTRAEVFVIYGCSEISCMGCTYPVSREETIAKTYVGRPFDNVVVKILDPAGNQMPIGAVGEIHFAGGGIVKGYLDRPDLTEEKFIQHDGQRFYRTGDMGRVSDDGWVEILGRNDFQIKIRGMRIELGEVDYNLRRAPGVRDAVVMAKTNPAGDKVMVGYVVFSEPGDRAARFAEVRRHMVDSVPDYMVPAMYVELDKLPVNHNLKVDRNALPDPEFAIEREASTLRAPETPTEQKLAALWMSVLGVAQVGLDDNFFDLGADSLLAMEMMTRADTELRGAVERREALIDGMDVLRESLEVLAGICDRKLGTSVVKAPRVRVASTRLETFFFDGLYGVLHGGAPAKEAVLICPPIGQEAIRAHFILSRVGMLLAARGMPVMRFDYYGLGDSEGDSVDASPARWQADIVAARDELVRKTGAQRITGIGARFGATLLATAGIAASLVLWDPIARGEEWIDEQAELHRRYLRGQQDLRRGRRPMQPIGGEERLGVTYSHSAMRAIAQLALPRFDAPVRWLATYNTANQAAHFENLSPATIGFESLAVDCGWRDITRFEDIIPDVGIAHALAGMTEASLRGS